MATTTEITHGPLVSILMLTYNRAPYIKAAIESVLHQTYQSFELVIIDDGSTDTTPDIVAGFTDRRITYIHHEDNQGLFVRRAESLKEARGTYVAILDSDDLWHRPDKLALQVAYLEANPTCVVVGSFMQKIDEDGQAIDAVAYHTTDAGIRRQILTRNQFAHSSVLMRASALTATAGYRYELAEDHDLFLQLGLLGTFGNIPEFLISYRVHRESETSKKRVMYRTILQIINKHKSAYPGYLRAVSKYRLAYTITVLKSWL